jgi:hypothetical protein
MFKTFLISASFFAVGAAVMPPAHAASAAVQGTRQDDTVMSGSGGAAWVDCDAPVQKNNPKCAKERERANGAQAPSSNTSRSDQSNKSTTVPLAGPEGKGVPRSGS